MRKIFKSIKCQSFNSFKDMNKLISNKLLNTNSKVFFFSSKVNYAEIVMLTIQFPKFIKFCCKNLNKEKNKKKKINL